MIVGQIQNSEILKILSNSWDILPFRKVLKDSSGGNMKIKSSDTLTSGKLPVIDQGKNHITGYTNLVEAKVNASLPLIVFGDHTRILKYVDFEFAMGADGTKILEITNPNVNAKYIYYYLKSLHIIDTGYNRHFKYIKDLVFPLPPLKTQKRIAQILDDAAALRDKTQQLLKEYDLLAQSIFLEMFGDPVLNQKDWNMLKLADVTTKIGSGATPRGGKESYKEKGISLIRSLNVHDNWFKMKDLAFIDKLQASKLNNVTIEEEDVLINITGASVARCTIVPYEILPARVNQHVSILRCSIQKVNPHFLLHLIISPNSKVKLLGVGSSNAATRESITKDQLESFEIIVPPIKLQNQFAEKIALIEKQKELAKQELKESEDLFNCLLQKAFKGELV